MKANPLCVTPLSVAIHRRDTAPVFGEGAIRVSVDDEGSGPYVRVLSHNYNDELEEDYGVAFEIEELKLVYTEALKLINAHRALEDKK